jgi:hypothetical protein
MPTIMTEWRLRHRAQTRDEPRSEPSLSSIARGRQGRVAAERQRTGYRFLHSCKP